MKKNTEEIRTETHISFDRSQRSSFYERYAFRTEIIARLGLTWLCRLKNDRRVRFVRRNNEWRILRNFMSIVDGRERSSKNVSGERGEACKY